MNTEYIEKLKIEFREFEKDLLSVMTNFRKDPEIGVILKEGGDFSLSPDDQTIIKLTNTNIGKDACNLFIKFVGVYTNMHIEFQKQAYEGCKDDINKYGILILMHVIHGLIENSENPFDCFQDKIIGLLQERLKELVYTSNKNIDNDKKEGLSVH